MKKITIAAIILIVIGGIFVLLGGEKNSDQSAEETASQNESVVNESQSEIIDEVVEDSQEAVVSEGNDETNTEESTASYTVAEIALHATPEDCWLSIDGKVFDVTEYIAAELHPGGDAILNGCGVADATSMFESIKEGEGHPDKARNFMQQYLIGEVAQ